MKKLLIVLAVTMSVVSYGQESAVPKQKFVPEYKVFKGYELLIGVGGAVQNEDKLSGDFAVGIDVSRRLKIGLSVGVRRFENGNFLPVQLLLNHQWNYANFFVFQELSGGYTYSIDKPEQMNYNDYYNSYSKDALGGLGLEGVLGVGIPLNDHIDVRLGVTYNYQELEEVRTYNYYYSTTSEFKHYHNRFGISGGLVFY